MKDEHIGLDFRQCCSPSLGVSELYQTPAIGGCLGRFVPYQVHSLWKRTRVPIALHVPAKRWVWLFGCLDAAHRRSHLLLSVI